MLRTKKSLGQNFLINAGILDKISAAAELNKNDIVLEVGPGMGDLTKKLIEKVRSTNSGQTGRVIAVEKDHRLIGLLKEKFFGSSVEIVEGDILKFNPIHYSLLADSYKVIGNIPYYITSHLLRKIFEDWPKPKLIVLMIQKEVAQRIMAKPPHMNLLALSVQFYSEPEIISYVSRGSFRPMPKVDSAIIRLTPRDHGLSTTDPNQLFKLVKTAFAGKRKQLASNLSKNFGIMKEDLLKAFDKIKIRPDARAENLSLNQWIELSQLIEK